MVQIKSRQILEGSTDGSYIYLSFVILKFTACTANIFYEFKLSTGLLAGV